jgi:antitoxin component YwqK of YwqJK toxin-antitoxin module
MELFPMQKSKLVLNINSLMKINQFILFLFFLNVQFNFAQKVVKTKHWGTNLTKEEYMVNANGQKNGFYKSYNIDGILLFSYNFKSGEEHGICIDYAGQRDGKEIYCYGKPLNERVMKDGKLISEKYYGCSNNSNYLIFTKKLISPGIYERIEYHKNGSISEKYNQNSTYGKEKGMYEKYYENGKLAEKGMIDNGENGTWLGLYENGDTMYFAKYTSGVDVFYKKYFKGNKVEYIRVIDDNFETITKIEYFEDGKIMSEKISKTYPFKYDCGSSNPPKNWRELAEQKIICAGQSYSPYDNSYLAIEKTYNLNGQLVSESNNVARNVNGKYKIFNKLEIEAEDTLWQNIIADSSYENLHKYYKKAKTNLYLDDVNKIFYAKNDKYQKEIDKISKECNNLNSESRIKSESLKGINEVLSKYKTDKLYVKFELASGDLDYQIDIQHKILSDLNTEISAMESLISDGGDFDLSKINKKELLLLINKKLEPSKRLNSLLILKSKLWAKFGISLSDKNLKKTFLNTTTTEELLELIKN